MITLVLTVAFGVLGALSMFFARRDEEGGNFFWIMATLCALAFGFSLGSFNQDARLRNEIAALTVRLQSEPVGEEVMTPLPGDAEPILPPEPEVTGGAETSSEEVAASTPPLEAVGDETLSLPEIASLPEPDRGEELPSSFDEALPLKAEGVEATPAEAALPETPDPVAVGETPIEVAPGSLDVATSDAALEDLSGVWEMVTTIERTAFDALAGLELTFRLNVEHMGETLNAVGNKAAERAPGTSRTLAYTPSVANRIVLAGRFVNADTLALSFEEGTEGRGGTMTLEVVSPERLEGVFLSSSADSGGSVVWRMLAGTGDG